MSSVVEEVGIGLVKPYPGNPRVHALESITASLRRFGFVAPLVVQRSTGLVVAGNGRLQAALSLGLLSVPVRYVDLTDEEAAAYVLADNRLGEESKWDVPLLMEQVQAMDDFDASLMQFDFSSLAGVSVAAVPALEAAPGVGEAAPEPKPERQKGIRKEKPMKERLDAYEGGDSRAFVLEFSAPEYAEVMAAVLHKGGSVAAGVRALLEEAVCAA